MNDTLDITTIILTYNEELHLRRCLENVKKFSRKIYVIDCFSTDKTVEIAQEYGAMVLQHKWENNYAKQFNWALDNCVISTTWILRLDADEYLLPETIEELCKKLDEIPENISGLILKRRHIFLERWMKRGTYPVKLLRIFRKNYGRCEQRLMDEHIVLSSGTPIELDYDFVDHNLNNLSWWAHKHVDYAVREAADLLDIQYDLLKNAHSDNQKQIGSQAIAKRLTKHRYAKLPLFWRAFAYFLYRYILRLGFLEGKEGFCWHFFQGLWYRMLVDAKIYEIKKICGNDPEKIRTYLSEHYHISLR